MQFLKGEDFESYSDYKVAGFDELEVGGNANVIVSCRVLHPIEKPAEVPM